ncbi:MAG: c-type cytochrome, partial [Planctomycetes bacterium]|nr:c-type cytochrome [Planctomycetota bacterium]
ALRLVDADDPALDAKLFQNLLTGDDATLKLEAVRTLQHSSKKFVAGLLTSVAVDEKAPVDLRAEAVTGLYGRWFDAPNSSEITQTLTRLVNAKQPPLQLEAIRSSRNLLVKTAKGRATRTALLKSLQSALDQDPQVLKRNGIHRQIAEQLALAHSQAGIPLPEIVKPVQADRPKTNADWYKQVVDAKGDHSAGRRIFFHADSAGCYKCHTVNGRGGHVGPDLSSIGRALNRKRLIESILEPSKEIAPQFTNWTFVMNSGKIHHGMILGDTRDDIQQVGTPEGQVIKLKASEIELRQPQKTSVMPEKLIDRMTVSEFRDLLAYLQSLK